MSARIYNGSTWEAAGALHFRNAADNGWEEVGSAWHWYNGAWERLYVKPTTVSDTFPTNGTLGAPWNSYSDNPTYMPQVASGAWRMSNNGTAGTNYGYSVHSTQLASDNVSVQASITTTNNTWPSWLIIASDSNGQNRVNLRWTDSSLELLRVVSGSDQSVLESATVSQAVGKVFQVTRVADVFKAYVDGALQFTYTDSSAVIPKGSGKRYVGLGGTRRQASFVQSWSPNMDNFSATDI